MIRCPQCKEIRDELDMIIDKTKSSGFSICMFCRDAIKKTKKTRNEIYMRALKRIIEKNELNGTLYNTIREIEKEILLESSNYVSTISEMGYLLGALASTLSTKLKKNCIENIYMSNHILRRSQYQEVDDENRTIGVYYLAHKDKWEAKISINKDRFTLGNFHKKKDAQEIYRVAKSFKDLYHGDKEDFIQAISERCIFSDRRQHGSAPCA